jgi:hypothetical protein
LIKRFTIYTQLADEHSFDLTRPVAAQLDHFVLRRGFIAAQICTTIVSSSRANHSNALSYDCCVPLPEALWLNSLSV